MPPMLSTEQSETLQAAVNRIIPEDDTAPGGWDAGVGTYLERQLAGDLQHLQVVYRAGLDALTAESRALAGVNFARLSAEQQDTVLAAVERGEVRARWLTDPAEFFTLLVQHCMEGFYSDPGSGGNRDQAAWRMIGFEVRG